MSSGGNTRKGMSQVPKGAQHEPDAVRRKKEARLNRVLREELGPRAVGSAAYRRRLKAKGK